MLRSQTHRECEVWLELYEQLFVAAASDLGCDSSERRKLVRVVVKILDSANQWCDWDGKPGHLEECVGHAITLSRLILTAELEVARPS